MRPKRINFNNIASKTVIMDGGLNENVSSIELKGGELIAGINYQLFEGSSGGYVSISGYERFDGQPSPAEVVVIDEEDTAREAARTLIGEVPGEGSILGIVVFESKVYAFRNKVGGATAGMYVSSAAGWVEIDTSASPLAPSGDYHFDIYNFYASVTTLSLFWSDGVNKARYYNPTAGVVVINNVGQDPNDKPINIKVHNDRLFLAYPKGIIDYTHVGDPNDFTGTAGEFGVGREITNLVQGVGNVLVIYCDEAIKVLKGSAVASEWILENFSSSSGAIVHTAKRLLGNIYAMDDRGVTSLAAVQEFGDFGANNISQKVQKTLLANKTKITQASVNRDLNQYRLFFNTGYGLYFSFLNKQLRGVTLIRFPQPVYLTASGEDTDGNNMNFFASLDSGYVYRMDWGTSFDGIVIDTKLSTAYYHYGSTRAWKRFKAIAFEIASRDDLDLNVLEKYDYADDHLPRGTSNIEDLSGAGDFWGEGLWGVMRYTAAEVTNRIIHNIKGIGSNLSVNLSTTSKYARQHTLQNFTTDYENARRQL